jgi:hypothetical protein
MTNYLTVLANSYLDHIRIAVEANDRGAPFRDFFDNWNAFRSDHGYHRSRGNRPRWFNNPDAAKRLAMLESLDFRSKGAMAIMDYARIAPVDYRSKYSLRDKSTKLIVDHAVPVSVMVNTLFQPGADLSREGISTYLIRRYHLGLLSHEENSRLDAAGLNSAMPVDWDGEDAFERYHFVGIEAA